jgi:hypothetical protein
MHRSARIAIAAHIDPAASRASPAPSCAASRETRHRKPWQSELTVKWGTEGSNPSPSTGESDANLTSSITTLRGVRRLILHQYGRSEVFVQNTGNRSPRPFSAIPRTDYHEEAARMAPIASTTGRRTRALGDMHGGNGTANEYHVIRHSDESQQRKVGCHLCRHIGYTSSGTKLPYRL